MRRCTKCGEEKPDTPEFFQPAPSRSRGLRKRHAPVRGRCLVCVKRKRAEHYQKIRDKVLAEQRATYAADSSRKKAWAATYREKNPEKQRLAQLRAHWRRKYNISFEDYERMYVAQGGCCAICRGVPIKGRLHIDHDHATGVVRGLLCRSCNIGLGHFSGPVSLRAAAAYLERVELPQLAEVIPLYRK